MLEGSNEAKILFVSDCFRVTENAERAVLSADRKEIITNALGRAGILASEVAWTIIHPRAAPGFRDANFIDANVRMQDLMDAQQLIAQHKCNVIVPLGSYALDFITGHESIFKQHCSVLPAKSCFGSKKALPMLHPEYVQRAFSDHAYIGVGCLKLKTEKETSEILTPQRNMLTSLDMSYEQIMSYLHDVVLKADLLSCDIETGRGMINTAGFAISAKEGIAIQCDLGTEWSKDSVKFHEMWKVIAQIWSSDIPKIAQNAIFEQQWAFRYGIMLRGIWHDTQWAMKFLHPELEKGLHNVGRLYTPFPYWKDDHSDWNNIRNWRDHLTYNVKDTTGQFAAAMNQQQALKDRKLDKLFYEFIMRYYPVIAEMCLRGLAIDEDKLFSMRSDVERNIDAFQQQFDAECESRLGRKVNTRSPKQMKEAFKELKIKIPTKKGKESLDKNAIVKLRKKYPDETILIPIMQIAKLNKQLSSYLAFDYDIDKRVRYTLDGVGTETGRWAGYMDPFGNGFNPQTVPKKNRICFVADPGKKLIQIDLQQAESRYVAFEAPEPKLMQMLVSGEDVHKYVASKIFKKPVELIGKDSKERQLGKKSGHAANYDVGPRTFTEQCLTDMDIVLNEFEAKQILDGYEQTFPGIRKRKDDIAKHVRRHRMLKTPLGRERHFYDRMGDNLFREAYAYCPQSTIPDITNHLMLFLYESFDELEFCLQVHDSLLLQFDADRIHEIAEAARDYEAWHPEINLPGGKLVIPVDIEVGDNWLRMDKI